MRSDHPIHSLVLVLLAAVAAAGLLLLLSLSLSSAFLIDSLLQQSGPLSPVRAGQGFAADKDPQPIDICQNSPSGAYPRGRPC